MCALFWAGIVISGHEAREHQQGQEHSLTLQCVLCDLYILTDFQTIETQEIKKHVVKESGESEHVR